MRSVLPVVAICAVLAGCGAKADHASGPAWLEDVTDAARVDFVHDSGHRRRSCFPRRSPAGCGIFDYDWDGWMDLYFVQAGPIGSETRPSDGKRGTNRLFRNRGDGTFEDTTAKAGVGAFRIRDGLRVRRLRRRRRHRSLRDELRPRRPLPQRGQRDVH